jgi:hypothetical protein
VQEGIRPTQLFSRNADVDQLNSREMAMLTTPEYVAKAHDWVRIFRVLKLTMPEF